MSVPAEFEVQSCANGYQVNNRQSRRGKAATGARPAKVILAGSVHFMLSQAKKVLDEEETSRHAS